MSHKPNWPLVLKAWGSQSPEHAARVAEAVATAEHEALDSPGSDEFYARVHDLATAGYERRRREVEAPTLDGDPLAHDGYQHPQFPTRGEDDDDES